jgi:hypothetical protein
MPLPGAILASATGAPRGLPDPVQVTLSDAPPL